MRIKYDNILYAIADCSASAPENIPWGHFKGAYEKDKSWT